MEKKDTNKSEKSKENENEKDSNNKTNINENENNDSFNISNLKNENNKKLNPNNSEDDCAAVPNGFQRDLFSVIVAAHKADISDFFGNGNGNGIGNGNEIETETENDLEDENQTNDQNGNFYDISSFGKSGENQNKIKPEKGNNENKEELKSNEKDQKDQKEEPLGVTFQENDNNNDNKIENDLKDAKNINKLGEIDSSAEEKEKNSDLNKLSSSRTICNGTLSGTVEKSTGNKHTESLPAIVIEPIDSNTQESDKATPKAQFFNQSIKNEEEESEEEHQKQIIKKLFQVDSIEIIKSYRCWLLKSVLLQGELCISNNAIFFYSFLPNKSKNNVVKAGSLNKWNGKTKTHTRYWCSLRAESFCTFKSSTDLYFPVGIIDLRSVLDIKVDNPTVFHKTPDYFSIYTSRKRYIFKADSKEIAEDWVEVLKKTTFRAQNDGGCVKIQIPIPNILDIENINLFEFAQSFILKVIDNEGSYAVDDYVFAIFKEKEKVFLYLSSFIEKRSKEIKDDKSSSNSKLSIVIDTIGQASERSASRSRSRSTSRARSKSFSRANLSHNNELNNDSNNEFDDDDDDDNGDGNSKHLPRSPRLFRHFPRLPSVSLTRSRSRSRSRGRDRLRLTDKDNAENEDFEAYENDPVDYQQMKSAPEEFKQGHASYFTGWFKDRSKLMSSYFTSNMDYLERMSEMLTGTTKHFDELIAGPSQYLVEDDVKESGERFRHYFSLPRTENLIASYFAHLQRAYPLYGKIYLSENYFCFRSLLPGTRTLMILPVKDLENVEKERGFRFGYSGLVVIISGHEEIFFEFGSSSPRNDCEMQTLKLIHKNKSKNNITHDSNSLSSSEFTTTSIDKSNIGKTIQRINTIPNFTMSPETNVPMDSLPIDDITAEGKIKAPLIFDSVAYYDLPVVPKGTKKHFICLTIGSRGDVQPYIALALGLIEQGNKVTIATHKEFGSWIESHGIGFRPIAGDPAKLMQLSVEYGVFSIQFLKEASAKFRTWIDELLITSWEACKDADILIESPSAMGGLHIAEALEIPYFRAFTMPWTRTRAYPHAFLVPMQKMGGSYNSLTYLMFENIFWQGIAGQINRWRKKTLKIPATSLGAMHQNKVPFLYNFSRYVVPPPVDYPDWVRVTGYWFLDEGKDYKPSQELMDFISKAKSDGKKLVYIGFGSIVVSNPKELTAAVIESVLKADIRCILSKGWSDRLNSDSAHESEIPLPPEIFQIKSAPHDWLFPQVDAAVHHGGSGTTGASLRAGIPTMIKPFFGDQFFYAGRVEDLGVGLYLKKINVGTFSKALREVTNNTRMIEAAKTIGKRIRSENGVQNAIIDIWKYFPYAESMIKKRDKSSKSKTSVEIVEKLKDDEDLIKDKVKEDLSLKKNNELKAILSNSRLKPTRILKIPKTVVTHSASTISSVIEKSVRKSESKEKVLATDDKKEEVAEDNAKDTLKSDNSSNFNVENSATLKTESKKVNVSSTDCYPSDSSETSNNSGNGTYGVQSMGSLASEESWAMVDEDSH